MVSNTLTHYLCADVGFFLFCSHVSNVWVWRMCVYGRPVELSAHALAKVCGQIGTKASTLTQFFIAPKFSSELYVYATHWSRIRRPDRDETKKKKIKTSSRNIYLRSADNNANDTITTNEHENQT